MIDKELLDKADEVIQERHRTAMDAANVELETLEDVAALAPERRDELTKTHLSGLDITQEALDEYIKGRIRAIGGELRRAQPLAIAAGMMTSGVIVGLQAAKLAQEREAQEV